MHKIRSTILSVSAPDFESRDPGLILAALQFSACTPRQGTSERHCYWLALGLNEQGAVMCGNIGDGSNYSKVGGSNPWGLQDNIVKRT